MVEYLAFRVLIKATGTTLSIKTADTLFNRIKEEFYLSRASERGAYEEQPDTYLVPRCLDVGKSDYDYRYYWLLDLS